MHILCNSVLQRVKNYCFHWFSIFVVEEISVIKNLPYIFSMSHEPLMLYNMGSFTMTLSTRILFAKIPTSYNTEKQFSALHFYMAIWHLFRHDHLSTHLTGKPKSFIVHATQHERVPPLCTSYLGYSKKTFSIINSMK